MCLFTLAAQQQPTVNLLNCTEIQINTKNHLPPIRITQHDTQIILETINLHLKSNRKKNTYTEEKKRRKIVITLSFLKVGFFPFLKCKTLLKSESDNKLVIFSYWTYKMTKWLVEKNLRRKKNERRMKQKFLFFWNQFLSKTFL